MISFKEYLQVLLDEVNRTPLERLSHEEVIANGGYHHMPNLFDGKSFILYEMVFTESIMKYIKSTVLDLKSVIGFSDNGSPDKIVSITHLSKSHNDGVFYYIDSIIYNGNSIKIEDIDESTLFNFSVLGASSQVLDVIRVLKSTELNPELNYIFFSTGKLNQAFNIMGTYECLKI